ncbi:MAG: FAD/NAD(P)-binding protein, partial [Terriglobales bacterium]
MQKTAFRSSVEIAIIGGGASGALTAVNLLQKWRGVPGVPPLKLTLIDAQAGLGRGVAYGTDCSLHLLNVPAKGMSAYPDQPDNFYEWLVSVQEDAIPETFARRSLYGEYLQHQLASTWLQPSATARLTSLKSKATAVARQDDIYVVQLDSGDQIKCDALVLALGNFPPQFGSYGDNDWFHNNPWDPSLSQTIGTQDTVLLIGTGLTMIDVALLLSCRGHLGQLHAVSRHGYVPQPH